MISNFDSFYTELISDQRWKELLRAYREETIKKAAEKVYAGLIADNTVDVRPMPENRKHVYNICIKGGSGDKPLPKPFQVLQAEKKAREANPLADPNCPHCKGSGGVKTGENEYSTCPCVNPWIPLTGEERQKKLAEFKALIDAAPIINGMPPISKKQAVEEGGWIPAKPAPYPITTPEEAYIKDRHFEYVKQNYEPRTGEKRPTWCEESLWNQYYDDQHLNGIGK